MILIFRLYHCRATSLDGLSQIAGDRQARARTQAAVQRPSTSVTHFVLSFMRSTPGSSSAKGLGSLPALGTLTFDQG